MPGNHKAYVFQVTDLGLLPS